MGMRCLLTIHENVNEEDLHCVQGIAQAKECAESNQSQGCNSRAELEGKEVLDVVEDGFACEELRQWCNTASVIQTYLLPQQARLC